MPHLLNVWPSVHRRIAGATHLLLLSDYDGTLAPIAARPDLAVLPHRTRLALHTINQASGVSVGVVSGRSLADVSSMVGLPGLIYAGNHGLEIQGNGLDFIHPGAEALKPQLDNILRELGERVAGIEGALVEGKGLTLSVHFRLTAEDQKPRVHAEFEEATRAWLQAGEVRVTAGKEVLEVRPNIPWDKGKAIARIASECPHEALVMYLGDDLTDEDGFAVVNDLNGLSVFVGPARQPTRALYRVDSPSEVATTLDLIAAI
ncbi:MAG: trehalose-phosphatase [Chloroflexi bacterium]|nr:trehalose-phosphatase [Chloroflexota bacterium]